MAQTLELLRADGWLTYHTFDSRRSTPGFPDIVAVRDGRMLAIECKTATGRATADQLHWLRELAGVRSVDAFILRPGVTMDALAIVSRYGMPCEE